MKGGTKIQSQTLPKSGEKLPFRLAKYDTKPLLQDLVSDSIQSNFSDTEIQSQTPPKSGNTSSQMQFDNPYINNIVKYSSY
ncbi:hypothetical protein V6N11_055964 [Hibiscus sabdariffa]|uniref:Uncharacterized protein n=1 Tax=Hibiscus sabdariffa TaxID=183260 RepID=A0ABR2T397_9ROSI